MGTKGTWWTWLENHFRGRDKQQTKKKKKKDHQFLWDGITIPTVMGTDSIERVGEGGKQVQR